jgi:hypothetical protein
VERGLRVSKAGGAGGRGQSRDVKAGPGGAPGRSLTFQGSQWGGGGGWQNPGLLQNPFWSAFRGRGGGGKIRVFFPRILGFWSAFWGRDPPGVASVLGRMTPRPMAGSASESVTLCEENLRRGLVGLGTRVRNTDLVFR